MSRDANIVVGRFLRAAREARGESQTAVFHRLGCKRGGNYISRIETGGVRVSSANLQMLAKAYGLTELEQDELVKIAGSADCDVARDRAQRRAEIEILYQLTLLPKDARERVIRAAQAYSSE